MSNPISVLVECPWCSKMGTVDSKYNSHTSRTYKGRCQCGAEIVIQAFPKEVVEGPNEIIVKTEVNIR